MIRENEVDEGYYFLSLALEYTGQTPPDYGQTDVPLPPADEQHNRQP